MARKNLSIHTVIDGKKTDKPFHNLTKADDEKSRTIIHAAMGKKRVEQLRERLNP